jgi:hypothetical protein
MLSRLAPSGRTSTSTVAVSANAGLVSTICVSPDCELSNGTIAVLRLDADWYESTITCLTHLYPHIAPGGIVIIDDYKEWDGCARAVHEFLFKHASGGVPRIRQFENRVYFVVKPSAI